MFISTDRLRRLSKVGKSTHLLLFIVQLYHVRFSKEAAIKLEHMYTATVYVSLPETVKVLLVRLAKTPRSNGANVSLHMLAINM